MKFLHNASIDTLSTQANLKRWKRQGQTCALWAGEDKQLTMFWISAKLEKTRGAGLEGTTVSSVMWWTVLTMRNTLCIVIYQATLPPGTCVIDFLNKFSKNLNENIKLFHFSLHYLKSSYWAYLLLLELQNYIFIDKKFWLNRLDLFWERGIIEFLNISLNC